MKDIHNIRSFLIYRWTK